MIGSNKRSINYRKRLTEAQEQESFFRWASYHYNIIPYLFHIPNGGARTLSQGRALKRQGVKAGVSDVFFAYPTRRYHGLWIEFKTAKGVISELQKKWLELMNKVGYYATVAYGWEHARDVLINYLRDE